MKKIVSFIIILLSVFYVNGVFAQYEFSTKSKKAIKSYKMAENKYRQYFFDEALEYLDEAIKKDPMFIEPYLLKADYYKMTKNYKLEIENLKKSISIDPNFFIYSQFNLGVAYYHNGQYLESKKTLQAFLNNHQVRKSTQYKVKYYIERCDVAIKIKSEPVPFEPHDLGKGINTNHNEYWPSISIDGNTMIYTVLLVDSSRTFMNGDFFKQEDFYISTLKDGVWQKGVPIGRPLNTPGNEGAHKISADGNTIVFTGCNRSDGFGNCDIYFSYKIDGKWTIPENAGRVINSRYSEKQPALSPDGRYLYFSSNRPGGKGGMDLWMSKRLKNGSWQKPTNLGDSINTKGDEVSPFIHSDNTTLFFSSNVHDGLGEQDIFYTKLKNNTWTKPKNLGYPINTHLDDFGLTIAADGITSYYATDINTESTDIYKFTMPKQNRPTPVSYITGRIFDKETNKNLDADFYLINTKTNDTIMHSRADKGKYFVCLPVGSNYACNVNKTGYLFYSVNFNLSEQHSAEKPYHLDIPLTKIHVGNSVILKNIFFATDSYELLPESTSELQSILSFALNNTNLVLEIGGHTDSRGEDAYNQQLSEKRARAVYNYLVEHGINPNRLKYKGYGEQKPIATNETSEGRQLNRRTELTIIK